MGILKRWKQLQITITQKFKLNRQPLTIPIIKKIKTTEEEEEEEEITIKPAKEIITTTTIEIITIIKTKIKQENTNKITIKIMEIMDIIITKEEITKEIIITVINIPKKSILQLHKQ